MKKIILIVALILILFLMIQFYPAISLKEYGMTMKVGDNTVIYYHQDRIDFVGRNYIEEYDIATSEILSLLQVDSADKINIYVYDNQYDILKNKYGFYSFERIGLGYITETNRGDEVLLVEPSKSNQVYHQIDDFRSLTEGVLRSLRDTYKYKSSDFYICGLANFIAYHKLDQKINDSDASFPNYDKQQYSQIDYNIFKKDLEAKEQYLIISAYYYVKYLEERYGEEILYKLLRNEDYESLLGKSHEVIFEEWRASMRQ